jgi:hypothetical protein
MRLYFSTHLMQHRAYQVLFLEEAVGPMRRTEADINLLSMIDIYT